MLSHTLTKAATAPTATATSPTDVFLGWLASFEKPDEVRLDDGSVRPLSLLLGELTVAAASLPADAARALGLPVGASVGDAATELLRAVADPSGPRCRSYRSAAYYLGGLDRASRYAQDLA